MNKTDRNKVRKITRYIQPKLLHSVPIQASNRIFNYEKERNCHTTESIKIVESVRREIIEQMSLKNASKTTSSFHKPQNPNIPLQSLRSKQSAFSQCKPHLFVASSSPFGFLFSNKHQIL